MLTRQYPESPQKCYFRGFNLLGSTRTGSVEVAVLLLWLVRIRPTVVSVDRCTRAALPSASDLCRGSDRGGGGG